MSNWKPAPDRPGYRCKIVQHGPATITIYRPIMDEAQAAKAQERTRTELERAMREHYSRTTRPAAV
jgi:hypothetical protein